MKFQQSQPTPDSEVIDNTFVNEQLAHDLGRLLGVPFSLADGAAVLTLANGREMWLESPSDSLLFIIHTKLSDSHSGIGLQELTEYLALNSQTDRLQGAYISLHQETQSFRICVALPTEIVNAELLQALFYNMIELADSLN